MAPAHSSATPTLHSALTALPTTTGPVDFDVGAVVNTGTGALPSATDPPLGTDGPAYHTGPVDTDVEAVVNAWHGSPAPRDGGVNAAASSATLKASLDMALLPRSRRARLHGDEGHYQAVIYCQISKGAAPRDPLSDQTRWPRLLRPDPTKRRHSRLLGPRQRRLQPKPLAKKVAAKTPAKKARPRLNLRPDALNLALPCPNRRAGSRNGLQGL